MKKITNILKKITSIFLIVLTILTCGSVKNVNAENYTLEENGYFSDLFDLSPLTPYHVGDLSVGLSGGSYNAWCIEPNVMTHAGDVYLPTYGIDGSDTQTNAKQIMLNYHENYKSNSLWDTEAGYYAVQLAIWGRIKGYDPANLTIIAQETLAQKVRTLASTLYNDHTNISYSLNFYYDGSTDVKSSYNLSKNDNQGGVTLFYDNGDWYYRSKAMSITNANYAKDVSFTVTMDGEGYITDSTGDNSNKYKTLTYDNINADNTFYIVYPVSKTAGETIVNISANYKYIDAVIWNYSSGNYGSGQKMISPHVGTNNVSYSVKFTRDAIDTEEEEKTTYTGTINLTKQGEGYSTYTTSEIDRGGNSETLYNLQGGKVQLSNAYFAFYTVNSTGVGATRAGKGTYRTSGSILTVNDIPLSVDDNGLATVLVCEVSAPEGYEIFNGTESISQTIGGETISHVCDQYGFKTENANDKNVITRDITLEDENKKFTVNVTKKDQNGNLLEGYEFGLYTTKDIKIKDKETIPAGSLVARFFTNENGVATFNGYLLADQNYVLKEIGSGDGDTTITVDGKTTTGTEVTLDVLNNATKEGYTFNIEVVNQIVNYGSIRITKRNAKNQDLLDGAKFSAASDDNIYTCTTEMGVCTMENVEYGTYTVYEVEAPEGYALNPDNTATITVNNDVMTLTFENYEKAEGTFSVKKNITGTASTSDAFDIKVEDISADSYKGKYETATTNPSNGIIKSGETKTYTYIFDKAGTYEFKVTENNCIHENNNAMCTDVNGKWTMDSTEYTVKFVVDDELNIKTYLNGAETTNAKIEFTNDYALSQITVNKTDSKTGVKLAGAEFELFKDKVSLGTKTTDVSGQIVWTELTYGDYTIKEVNAPSGYIKDEETHSVTLNKDNKNAIVNIGNIHELEINLKINKSIVGINSTTDKFEFDITNKENADDINNTTIAITGKSSNTTVLKFTKAGEYEYEVSEKDYDNWTVDKKTHRVKVIVTDEMEYKIYVDGVESEKASIEFVNTLNIKPVVITINKEFNLSNEDAKSFTSSFAIKQTNGSDTKAVTIEGNGSSSISFNYDKVGTYTYKVYENKLNAKNVTYDENVYDLTIEVKYEDGEVKTIASQNEFTFNNTYLYDAIKVYMPITKVLEGSTSKDYVFEFKCDGESITTLKGAGKIDLYKTLTEGEYT